MQSTELKYCPPPNNQSQQTLKYSYKQPKGNKVYSRVRFDYEAKSPNVRYIDENIVTYGEQQKSSTEMRKTLGLRERNKS